MFPISFVESFLKSKNIKTIFAIVFSCILFFIGALTAPSSKPVDMSSDDTAQTVQADTQYDIEDATTAEALNFEESTIISDDTISNDEETIIQSVVTNDVDNTSITEKQVEKVWIPSSGSKYHSRATCSNMSSPRQVSIDDAQRQGYTACKKCY